LHRRRRVEADDPPHPPLQRADRRLPGHARPRAPGCPRRRGRGLRGLSTERLVRISELRTTVVSVPFREDETWIWGRRRGITNALVEIETDDGLTGIGECPGHPGIASVRQVLDSVRDVLVGEDPLRIERILQLLLARRGLHHF